MLPPWVAIAITVGTGLGLLAGLTAWRARTVLYPELMRKLLHMGIGLIFLSFPWMFGEMWPVMIVVGAGLIVLAAMHTNFGRRFHGVLDDVDRVSWGDVCFLFSAAVIFLLSGGDPLMFSVPLLVLTFADSAAALVGVRFGQIHYAVFGSSKSVEGSMTFFVVAFICIQIPILLLGDKTPFEALGAAAILACITTLIEAVSHKGLDNLLVPLAAFGGLIVMQ